MMYEDDMHSESNEEEEDRGEDMTDQMSSNQAPTRNSIREADMADEQKIEQLYIKFDPKKRENRRLSRIEKA